MKTECCSVAERLICHRLAPVGRHFSGKDTKGTTENFAYSFYPCKCREPE